MGIIEKMRLDGKKAFVTGGARGIDAFRAYLPPHDAAANVEWKLGDIMDAHWLLCPCLQRKDADKAAGRHRA